MVDWDTKMEGYSNKSSGLQIPHVFIPEMRFGLESVENQTNGVGIAPVDAMTMKLEEDVVMTGNTSISFPLSTAQKENLLR